MAEHAKKTTQPEGAPEAAAPELANAPIGPVSGIEPLPFKASDYRREIKRVKRRRRRRVVLGIILALLVAAAVVAVVVFKVPGSLHVVHGDDMKPILADGQVVLTQEVSQPGTNDVIVYRTASGAERVERVVAQAGDWVNVASDGTVVISAMSLEGNSAAGIINGKATITSSRQVPVGYCFVLGDAIESAPEGFSASDNFVALEDILGKATYKIWPIFNMSAVH